MPVDPVIAVLFSHNGSRWQFCSITQWPRCEPCSNIDCATGPCPCPSAMNFIFEPPIPSLLAISKMSVAGSAPGESTKTTGTIDVDCW